MVKHSITVVAGEDISCGHAVIMEKRRWRERLFTFPWHPWCKNKVSKANKVLSEISKIKGVGLWESRLDSRSRH